MKFNEVRRSIAIIAIGILVSGVGSLYAQFEARAAVRVRPSLAEVGFMDAMLTGHGADWLYYKFPVAMTIITVCVVTLALVVFEWWRLR